MPVILPDRPPERASASGPPAPAWMPPVAGPGETLDSPPSGQEQTRIRGPFEPLEPLEPPSAASEHALSDHAPGGVPGLAGQLGPAEPAVPEDDPAGEAGEDEEAWPPTSAKLEQIKDLYLTAEAIGDDALAQYFQQVSERQRQLIKEYFDEAVSGGPESRPSA